MDSCGGNAVLFYLALIIFSNSQNIASNQHSYRICIVYDGYALASMASHVFRRYVGILCAYRCPFWRLIAGLFNRFMGAALTRSLRLARSFSISIFFYFL